MRKKTYFLVKIEDNDSDGLTATVAFKPSMKSIEKHEGLNSAFTAIVAALSNIEEPVDLIQEGYEKSTPSKKEGGRKNCSYQAA